MKFDRFALRLLCKGKSNNDEYPNELLSKAVREPSLELLRLFVSRNSDAVAIPDGTSVKLYHQPTLMSDDTSFVVNGHDEYFQPCTLPGDLVKTVPVLVPTEESVGPLSGLCDDVPTHTQEVLRQADVFDPPLVEACANGGKVYLVPGALHVQSRDRAGPSTFDLTSAEDQVRFTEMFGEAGGVWFTLMGKCRSDNNTYGCMSLMEDAAKSDVDGALATLVGAKAAALYKAEGCIGSEGWPMHASLPDLNSDDLKSYHAALGPYEQDETDKKASSESPTAFTAVFKDSETLEGEEALKYVLENYRVANVHYKRGKDGKIDPTSLVFPRLSALSRKLLALNSPAARQRALDAALKTMQGNNPTALARHRYKTAFPDSLVKALLKDGLSSVDWLQADTSTVPKLSLVNFMPQSVTAPTVYRDLLREREESQQGLAPGNRRATEVTPGMIPNQLKDVARSMADVSSAMSCFIEFEDPTLQPGYVEMFDELNATLETSTFDAYFDKNRKNLLFLPNQMCIELDRLVAGTFEWSRLSPNVSAGARSCAKDLVLDKLDVRLKIFRKFSDDLVEKGLSGDLVKAKYHDFIPRCIKDPNYVPPATQAAKKVRIETPSTDVGGRTGQMPQALSPPTPAAGFGFATSSRRGRRSSGTGTPSAPAGPLRDGFLIRVNGYRGPTLPENLREDIDEAFVTAGMESERGVPRHKRVLWRSLSEERKQEFIRHVDANRSRIQFNGLNLDIKNTLLCDPQHVHLVGNVQGARRG